MRHVLKVGFYFLSLALLGGCSYLFRPTLDSQYDFSSLGTDVFSYFVREAFGRYPPLHQINFHRDTGPYTRTIISRQFMSVETHNLNTTVRLRNFWMGKSRAEVEELFSQAGGQCRELKSNFKEKRLYCDVIRQWKLTGWSVPEGVSWSRQKWKLVHGFFLSGVNQVIGLNLRFENLTEYPKSSNPK